MINPVLVLIDVSLHVKWWFS